MDKSITGKIKRYLTLKKIKGYKIIDGWISPDEACGLYTIAKKLNANATIVEIGSWQGKSTYCLAKGLKNGKINAIDPFNGYAGATDLENKLIYQELGKEKDLLNIFRSNMKMLGVNEKIIVKKGFSADFGNDFDKIDFLFIDGDHSIEGCKSDYKLYGDKVVTGGFIGFHDYYENRPELGPTYVVNNLVQNDGFEFYALYDSLWLGIKKR
jgi:predicted O-methyltransferase YrrM